jgi:hypothetical protein
MSNLAALREHLTGLDDQAGVALLDAHAAEFGWPLASGAPAPDADPDPIERVRAALRDGHSLVHREDVRQLLGAHDHRGRALDGFAQREAGWAERGADWGDAVDALPDPTQVGVDGCRLADAVVALVRDLDNAQSALRAAAARESELVDLLADKVPAVERALADQPLALVQLRRMLAADVVPGSQVSTMRALADQLAVEWSHYTGLRRRWQRAHNERAALHLAVADLLAALADDTVSATVHAAEATVRMVLGAGQREVDAFLAQHFAHDAAVRELLDAHAALPDSVARRDGWDAAPSGSTLADRIRALTVERDASHNGHGRCHARHLDVEAAARRMLRTLSTTTRPAQPALDDEATRLHAVLARHRAARNPRDPDRVGPAGSPTDRAAAEALARPCGDPS